MPTLEEVLASYADRMALRCADLVAQKVAVLLEERFASRADFVALARADGGARRGALSANPPAEYLAAADGAPSQGGGPMRRPILPGQQQDRPMPGALLTPGAPPPAAAHPMVDAAPPPLAPPTPAPLSPYAPAGDPNRRPVLPGHAQSAPQPAAPAVAVQAPPPAPAGPAPQA